jgi:hypothetical protein
MLGFNPYFALAGVVALASAAGGGFVYGTRYAHGQEAATKNAALEKALQGKRDAENRIAGLEAAAAIREQGRQTIVREINREIPTIVREPVYRNVCIDDAGVRALDRAAAAANGVDPGATAGGAGAAAGDAAHR